MLLNLPDHCISELPDRAQFVVAIQNTWIYINHGTADHVKCECFPGLRSWSIAYYITQGTNPDKKPFESFKPLNTYYENIKTHYPSCSEVCCLLAIF